MLRKLTNIVKGAAVKLDATNTYAVNKQTAIAICYGSALPMAAGMGMP